METNPTISIIVPVYKVEPYLDRCVQSIVNQTYQNLEIILVDDGSPDNCPAMCDAWAKRDSRIKVIHKENGGLSDARNAGMAAATGELMGFVDSDDWLHPDMYCLLYAKMQADNSDIAACGVQMIWEDNTPLKMLTKPGCCVLNTTEAMAAIIDESWLKQPVWYKLYKTELVRNIPFPIGKYHEDVFWSYQAVAKTKCVSVIDTPCYYYWQRTDSIMGENYSLKRLDGLGAKVLRLKFVEETFPSLLKKAKTDLLFSCIYAMQKSLQHLSGEDLTTARRRIRQAQAEAKPFGTFKGLPFKQRLWGFLSQISFEGTCKLRNALNVGL